MTKGLVLSIALLLFASFLYSQAGSGLLRKARVLHFSSLVLDTHIDTTPKLGTDWKMAEEHGSGHVDLPRLKKGGLGGLFFSIYIPGTTTGTKAVREAIELISYVHELTRNMPARFALCTTAAQVREARKQGRVAALIGMEGGHMIDDSLAVLRVYAALGVRYLTLTHSVGTNWADSSGDQPRHGGLTDFGKSVIRELNRLGILADISHVSDKTFWDVLEASRAPLIASHSSCRALVNHPRNMTDEMIRALAARGGVIQINYHVEFIDQRATDYYHQAEPLAREIASKMGEAGVSEKVRAEVERRLGPPPRVSWERVIEHIDHAVKLVGSDHVGLGSDFDGAVMPDGLDDVSKLPRITEALLQRGYREADIRKILGENTLRLLEAAESTAAAMK